MATSASTTDSGFDFYPHGLQHVAGALQACLLCRKQLRICQSVPTSCCPAATGVRMQDSLAALGGVQEEDMPASRFIRPKRLTFEQAGDLESALRHLALLLAVLLDGVARCRAHAAMGRHTIVRCAYIMAVTAVHKHDR